MDPLASVVQIGIGLAAELKATSKERKTSTILAEKSSTGEYGLNSLVFCLTPRIAHDPNLNRLFS